MGAAALPHGDVAGRIPSSASGVLVRVDPRMPLSGPVRTHGNASARHPLSLHCSTSAIPDCQDSKHVNSGWWATFSARADMVFECEPLDRSNGDALWCAKPRRTRHDSAPLASFRADVLVPRYPRNPPRRCPVLASLTAKVTMQDAEAVITLRMTPRKQHLWIVRMLALTSRWQEPTRQWHARQVRLPRQRSGGDIRVDSRGEASRRDERPASAVSCPGGRHRRGNRSRCSMAGISRNGCCGGGAIPWNAGAGGTAPDERESEMDRRFAARSAGSA